MPPRPARKALNAYHHGDLRDALVQAALHEVGDGSVPAGLEDKAWLAQSNCPEIAIEVTEE